MYLQYLPLEGDLNGHLVFEIRIFCHYSKKQLKFLCNIFCSSNSCDLVWQNQSLPYKYKSTMHYQVSVSDLACFAFADKFFLALW